MFNNDVHYAWKVSIGLLLAVFVLIVTGTKLILTQQDSINSQQKILDQLEDRQLEIQAQQEGAEERGYAIRATSGCIDLINDGEIEITSECTSDRVIVYYPPSICEKLEPYISIEVCGTKADLVVPILNSRQTFEDSP